MGETLAHQNRSSTWLACYRAIARMDIKNFMIDPTR
jgi:hypothetical protein